MGPLSRFFADDHRRLEALLDRATARRSSVSGTSNGDIGPWHPWRPKGVWSQINREHIARLTKAGRMTPHGQRHVDAARGDGRWAAAYAPIRTATEAGIPDDLRAAIGANPRARRTFRTLSRQNLFALAFRTNNMKTSAGRARKIADLVAVLARGETIVPQR